MNADPGGARGGGRAASSGKLPQAHGGSQPGLSARLRTVTDAAE